MVIAQAAEPIVALTYGENRANYGSMDEHSSHPMRQNPDELKNTKFGSRDPWSYHV